MIIDNFRKSYYYGTKSSGMSRSQDKGHSEQFRLFLERLKNGGEAIISIEEIINTSKASLAAIESLTTKSWVRL